MKGGHGMCIEYLLTQGANPNSPRHDGATPFYIACLMGHLPVVKLIYGIRGPEAFDDSTLDGWTPFLAAVQRGHQDISVFLVDTHRRTHTPKAHHQYMQRRTVRGHTAIQLAKKRGQTRIAAYIEWSLGVPGTEEHSRAPVAEGKGFMKNRIPNKADSESECGLQAFVQNKGRWGSEADEDKVDPLDIKLFGFDTRTPKSKLVNSEMWDQFSVRTLPRKKGGPSTTLNVFECLGQEFNDSTVEVVEKPHVGKFSRAKAKLSEAQNLMEHGSYEVAARLFISAAVLFSVSASASTKHSNNSFLQGRLTGGNSLDVGASFYQKVVKSPYERTMDQAKNSDVDKEDKKYARANQRVCQKMAAHCRRALQLESKEHCNEDIEELLASSF
jgi:hypothetical protein